MLSGAMLVYHHIYGYNSGTSFRCGGGGADHVLVILVVMVVMLVIVLIVMMLVAFFSRLDTYISNSLIIHEQNTKETRRSLDI